MDTREEQAIKQAVGAAVDSALTGVEPDPAVFEFEIRTLTQAAIICASRNGVPPEILLALLAAECDVASAGQTLPMTALEIPEDTSPSDALRGFDEVCRQLQNHYGRTGTWEDALVGRILHSRVILPNGTPATAEETRSFIERSLAYLSFYRSAREQGAEMRKARH